MGMAVRRAELDQGCGAASGCRADHRPPHRHSGPAFGYVTKGAVRFELEGEPERVVEAGGTFWEPGGDAIHYQDGNALADETTEFVVTMMCAPGRPMLELVDEAELKQPAHLRAPDPPPELNSAKRAPVDYIALGHHVTTTW
jgi:Cupin domain